MIIVWSLKNRNWWIQQIDAVLTAEKYLLTRFKCCNILVHINNFNEAI